MIKRKGLFPAICLSILLISGFCQYASATPMFGSIRVSIMLVDSQQNIIDARPEDGIFLIELNSPGGFSRELEFQTAISLNHSVFSSVNNSQSILINNLPIYNLYYYSEMIVKSGNWKVLGYNDQLKTNVNSLGDFYQINDKNLDSNRIINLALSRGKDRELVILLGSASDENESPSPTPEPGTLLMIGAGLSTTILGSQIKRKLKRQKTKLSSK